ncbi:MAG TPA: hypothetical protein DHW78_05755 [Ruminococcaceae bacterium]|nr:cyclic lactone autoinducer peptide [Oscillospiraceae bacterium]HCM23810.1 hypothetical protein [Oscillospiraceae bacterium]
MKKPWQLLAKLVKKAAKFGAGATSATIGYQPKTPKCLQDQDK